MASEVIELKGHIIDSWTLPRAWDTIMDRGGNFAVEEMRVGTSKTEPSYARLKVEAPDDETLELIISELQQFGAVLLHGNDAQTAGVELSAASHLIRPGGAVPTGPGKERS